VTDRTHRPRLDAVLAAIDWLGEAGARTVNLSLGFAPEVPGADRLCAAIDRWTDRGVLFVAAAGNEGPDVPRLPAACPGGRVLAVASDEPTSGTGDVRAQRAVRTDYAGHLGALGRAAVAAAEAGRRAEAEAGLAAIAAEARRSGLGVAHGVEGMVAHALGDRAAAFAAWGRMAEALPTDPAPRYNRAVLLFEAGEPAAAAAELAPALAINPQNHAALWFDAVIQARLNDRPGTIAALERLLAVAPDHRDAAGLRDALASDDGPPADVLRRHFSPEP
jgi:tetratricopeptide (TPR) repeat protein